MRTRERLLVDARGTWKPYRVAYEVLRTLRGLDTGAVVEVITKDDTGLLNDLGVWCRATGHELLTMQVGQGEARVLIRKGEPVRNDKTMTVIMSTASLEHAMYPLDKALAGAVLGMDVNVVFEGAAVRLLKRGYRSRLSGLVGGLFTAKVEGVMKKEIGWPLPQESILILEDLGDAHAVFAGRREKFPLPDISMCLAVAITHSPAIDAVSVASMAALPVTRAMTPAASASAPIAEASTT
jgi:TusA-related sulfurtransferase